MPDQPDGSNVEASQRSRQILVADDDPVMQVLVSAFLEKAGYRVTLADDGAEAVAAVARQTFDLILIDLNMPVMDGATAAARIRAGEAHGRRVPIVALTAAVGTAEQAHALASGIDAFLAKPFDRDGLLSTVARYAGPAPADR